MSIAAASSLHNLHYRAATRRRRVKQRQLMLVALMVLTIHLHNSSRNRSYLLRSALVSHHDSAWTHLYYHADDGSFLNITGFNRASFNFLVTAVFPPGEEENGPGRPSIMDKKGKIGLVLYYLGSNMKYKFLSQLFGIVPSTVGEILRYMLPLLKKRLSVHPLAAVKFPRTVQEQEKLAAMVARREP